MKLRKNRSQKEASPCFGAGSSTHRTPEGFPAGSEGKRQGTPDTYYRQFVQMAREGFWMADRHWCTVMVNPRLCELLGFAEDEMLGKHIADFYFPEDQQRALVNLAARQQGEENRYVVRYRRKNGSELWAEISVKPMFDEAGQFEGAIALLVDVGEKLAAEQELRATRELMRTAAEVLGLGFWEADVKTGHMVWTRELEILFGFAPGSYDGSFHSFYARIHPEDREAVRAAYERAIQTNEPYTYDYRIGSSDSGYHWIGARGRVMTGPDGLPSRSVGVAVSIDDLKRLEEQLFQSQRLEALGRLVGSVAHDFNNFLTTICGYTELAQISLGPNEDAAAYLKYIDHAGTRATELVKQLLTFARRQGGAQQSVDLNQLTQGLTGILTKLLGDKIDLVMDLAETSLAARIDPVQFEQVIVNLAVNAADAMPDGGTFTISTGASWNERHEWVLVTVQDTGIGMDSATKERIFDPFFTTKEPGKGTGLGLSTCYGILNSLGGQIVVSSEPSLGTKFELLFPRAPSATPAEGVLADAEPKRGSDETLLLIEDEHSVRSFAAEALRKHGYKVLEAPCGSDAMLIASGYPGFIDLVITDLVMPQMDGNEIVSRMRTLRPSAKILMTSGSVEELSTRAESEDRYFLKKPFVVGTLLNKVHEILNEAAA